MKRTLTVMLHPCIYPPVTAHDISAICGDDESAAGLALSFSPHAPNEYMARCDVGDPFEVSVEIDTDRVVSEAIATMRQEQQNVRAAAEAKAQTIERTIQSLLAIGMDQRLQPAAEDAVDIDEGEPL